MTRTFLRAHRPRTLVSALAVTAIAGSMAYGGAQAGASATTFRTKALVADQAGRASLTDHTLVNPWGLAFGPNTPIWVADNGADAATLYKGGVDGSAVSKVPLTVSITGGAPTGQVYNGGSGFVVRDGMHSAPALFIFASEDGDITGWAPSVAGGATAVHGTKVNTAVFKGLAMAPSGTHDFLYATDFHNGRVDVFDDHYHRVNIPNGFVDPNLPAHYAPFGIQLIGKQLYVSYAVQDSARHDDSAGAGHGLIDVYQRNGKFIRRLVSHGALDSPWGMVIAPRSFGRFAGDLLVGNFGDGAINVYDPMTGMWEGGLKMANGKPLVIEALWGLAVGNGTFGGTDEVVFSAGTDHEAHGTLGVIQAR